MKRFDLKVFKLSTLRLLDDFALDGRNQFGTENLCPSQMSYSFVFISSNGSKKKFADLIFKEFG